MAIVFSDTVIIAAFLYRLKGWHFKTGKSSGPFYIINII